MIRYYYSTERRLLTEIPSFVFKAIVDNPKNMHNLIGSVIAVVPGKCAFHIKRLYASWYYGFIDELAKTIPPAGADPST